MARSSRVRRWRRVSRIGVQHCVVNDAESFALGRRRQAVIKGNDLEACRPILRENERRRELERIGGAQVVDAQKPSRGQANRLDRVDHMPNLSQAAKLAERVVGVLKLEQAHSFESGDSRSALDRGRPPHCDPVLVLEQCF